MKKKAQLASALALTVTWALNDKNLAEYTFDDETFRTTPFNFVEILNAATSPRICRTCGYLRKIGELCDLLCECQYLLLHPKGKRFFPKTRVICSGCETVRYLSGVFVACPCVKKCQQELRGTEYWR